MLFPLPPTLKNEGTGFVLEILGHNQYCEGVLTLHDVHDHILKNLQVLYNSFNNICVRNAEFRV